HTWMYHADLLGGIAARLAGGIPVLWAIHNTTLDPKGSKPLTRRIARWNGRLSHILPSRIVSVSDSGRELHRALGYDTRRMVVIPNGIAVEDYAPNLRAAVELRAMLEVDAATPLVGVIARFDPQKDHRTSLQA